jgi:hypothetical protein
VRTRLKNDELGEKQLFSRNKNEGGKKKIWDKELRRKINNKLNEVKRLWK